MLNKGLRSFAHPSQIPPKMAALHRLRFSLRGMPVQMGGKQLLGLGNILSLLGKEKAQNPLKQGSALVLYAV